MFRPRRVALALATAALLATIGLAGSAQANVQIPGLNGRIAWATDQDFPQQLNTKGEECFSGDDCSVEIHSMNPDGSDPVRLTNNLLYDDEPAWLPFDGANIAFESDSGCSKICDDHLWSMTSAGSGFNQLTLDSGDQFHPSYSPDGSKIAYVQDSELKQFSTKSGRLVPPGGPFEQIMIVPAAGELAGGIPTLLVPPLVLDQFTGYEDTLPAWSPDGTKIAFTRVSLSMVPDPLPSVDGVTAPSTGETITLDGRTFVAPASGGGPATPVEQYAPCVFHESNQTTTATLVADLAKAASTGDTRSIRRSSARLAIGGSCTLDSKPAWSPDGSKIAVDRLFTGTLANPGSAATRGSLGAAFDEGDIVVFNSANGSNEVNLSDVSEPANCNTDTTDAPECSADDYPDWSPDGTKIVFHSNRLADGSGPGICLIGGSECDDEIWVMNADGSSPTQLTNNSAEDRDPDWQRIPFPVAPPAQPASPVKPKVGVAGVRRACVSKSFHVRFRVTTTASTVKKVVVKLDRKRIKSTSKSSFTLSINSRKLKAGRHRLTITATNAAGQVTTTHKSFSVCKAAKPRRKAAPRFTG